jgi:2-methylcitrate dehydratase PrpD
VESIVVEGPDFLKSYDRKAGFEREIAARFSLPYVAAAAVLFDPFNLKAFGSTQRSHPKLKALAKRVTVVTDENFEKMFPGRFQTRVRVKTRGDRSWEKVCGLPWGPENPPTDPELEGKFSYLAGHTLKPLHIEKWLGLFREGVEKDKTLKKTLGLLSQKVQALK